MSFNTVLIIFWVIMIPVALYRYFFVALPAWTQPSRASIENKLLAGWTYSKEEWANYSQTELKILRNESIKNSVQGMKVDITSKYITFTTGAISDHAVIDGKCVRTIDCSISGNILNIVRGVRYPSRIRERYDRFQKLVFQLPIPNGFEREAANVVEYFKVLIREEAENITELYAAGS